MNNSDYKWADKFNDDNLDEQEWLDMGPDILAGIEDRIYEKPKRKKGWMFFLVGVLGLVTVAGWYLTLGSAENVSAEARVEEKIENSLSQHEAPNTKLITNDPIISGEKTEAERTEATAYAEQAITQQSRNELKRLSSAKNRTKAVANSIPSESTNRTDSSNALINESYSQINDNLPSSSIISSKINSEDLSNSSGTETKETVVMRGLMAAMPSLPVVKFTEVNTSIVNSNSKKLSSAKHPSIIKMDKINNAGRWYAQVGLGIVHMKLNQNYQAALSPAAFYADRGEASSVEVGRIIPIDSRLSVRLGAGYERTNFISGHNTTVDSSDLLSAENNVSLTMATPLGFIEGTTVLTRENDTSFDNSSLLIDLTNQHRYQAAEVKLGLTYDIISRSSFNLELESVFTWKRLFHIQNELIGVDTNTLAFSSTATSVTNDQESINKSLPELALGFSINKITSARNSVGLYYQYKTSLKPIHTLQDFSTSYWLHTAGLRYEF